MSNRNDDIKNLFAHLGLNAEDYLELRRQSGGTEAGHPAAADTPPGTQRRTRGPAPQTTHGHERPSGRFNANEQPKVYLPGLTSDPGAPEQPPTPVSRPTPSAPTKPTEPVAASAPDTQPAEPQRAAPARRWAMVDAVTHSVASVAKVRSSDTASEAPVEGRSRGRVPPYVEPVIAHDRPAVETPTPKPAPTAAGATVTAPGASAAGGANVGLRDVLTRLTHPSIATPGRPEAPQLRYAPRPLAGQKPVEAPVTSELGAVLGRLGRARR